MLILPAHGVYFEEQGSGLKTKCLLEYKKKANGLQILLYDVNVPSKHKEKTHNGKKKTIKFSVTFTEIFMQIIITT